MTTREFHYTSSEDGLQVFVREWRPEGEPKAAIHINHGMAEHSARYGRLAKILTSAGYVVWAQDHRGHGKSIPSGQAPGHMADENGWQKAAADVAGIFGKMRSEFQGVPALLMGHSMGSFLVQEYLIKGAPGADGVIMSGSNGKPPPIAALGRLATRVERLRLGRTGVSKLMGALSFGEFNKAFAPNRTDFDWLSRDPEEVDAYVADEFCGFEVSVQCWLDMLDNLGKLTASGNLARVPKRLPIFIFAGNEDPVGDFGKGIVRLTSAYRNAGLERVRMRLYAGARHETLNETNRDEVMAEVLSFCEQACADATALPT